MEIERRDELMQETKTEDIGQGHEDGPGGMDLFLGRGHGPVAYISTDIVSQGPSERPEEKHPRFHRLRGLDRSSGRRSER